MIRVLHLDTGREMRGGQWQALRLHRSLLERGHSSVLLAGSGSPLLERGAEIARPFLLRKFSKEFDLIHAHDAKAHAMAALLSRAPLVVSRRVAFPVKRSAVSKWKYNQPVLFLAVSNFVGLELRKAGVPDSRIRVVYDGVPFPSEPARGDTILVPGTDDPRKGLALAQRAARRAGVTLQPSDNFDRDMPSARALVYLSQSEGLGSAILLGMAHGLTVIASRTGGIPEAIEDGVTGILVRNDEADIAAAFARISPDLGRAARQTAERLFTVDRMVEGTVGAYRELIGHD